ncbi:PREDICTED: uncharacterized protein LOC109580376 [Amphimedon queenslandica]|uniref:Homeobox domain-containing protein n=1 Tax=Amphimedon queenslandica TaxID=400682 RepID=A0A1X7VGR0_AMPQE|nr:PREDICTED: uncharacterized protein LOC109580376 [Amphimedon queenslandica]|eukprot:XP_019849003.1 PREDICTED: uncharacterized protein LOC109580376 [Amphimedon queenslandica]
METTETQADHGIQVTSPEEPVVMVTSGEAPPISLTPVSTEVQTSPPVTTISASALVEILNSVATAIVPGDGGTGANLQLQFQLTPATNIEVVGCMQEVSDQVSGGGRVEGQIKGKGQSLKKQTGGRGNHGKLKDKQPWHYHLGGVRHCRVPLSPEIKEALEVAYVSRIMSKNFRKEGQPEKERIAQLTGLELDKVQEWFKNRRKKDKLVQSRVNSHGTPKGKRGRKLLLPHSVTRSLKNTPPNATSGSLLSQYNQVDKED